MDRDITVAIHSLMCSGIVPLKILEIRSCHDEVLLNKSTYQRGHTMCYMFFKWHILNLWPCASDGSHLRAAVSLCETGD